MKTVILTSSAYLILGEIAKHLALNPSGLSVAFIPTASDVYEQSPWVEQDRTKLIELGFQVRDVDLKSDKDTLAAQLSADVIFVAGGNTFYLLQELRKSGVDKIISQQVPNGTIYIGSSAGAAVAGPSLELLLKLDHPEKAPDLTSYNALNLCDITPLIHFGHPKFVERYKETFDSLYVTKNKYICIRDDQALIIRGDTYQLI